MKINPEIRTMMVEAAIQLKKAQQFYQQAEKMKNEAEDEILMRMFNKIFSSNEPLSAKEISARLNGDMSWQEVSGQLILASNPMYQNCTPKHDPTKQAQNRKAVKRSIRSKTKRFMEVDENGMIKPYGDVVIRQTTNVVYSKAK